MIAAVGGVSRPALFAAFDIERVMDAIERAVPTPQVEVIVQGRNSPASIAAMAACSSRGILTLSAMLGSLLPSLATQDEVARILADVGPLREETDVVTPHGEAQSNSSGLASCATSRKHAPSALMRGIIAFELLARDASRLARIRVSARPSRVVERPPLRGVQRPIRQGTGGVRMDPPRRALD